MNSSAKILLVLLGLCLYSCKKIAPTTNTHETTREAGHLGIANNNFPEPLGIINDYGSLISFTELKELHTLLYNYDIETTRQIVIVTIDSIEPYSDIQKYATDLGQTWGVGTKEKDNGLTIVVCVPCHEIGIATGLGTEKILTDEICKEVIDKHIIPAFKEKEYYKGIKSGVLALKQKWK